jgi:hypothetical protein
LTKETRRKICNENVFNGAKTLLKHFFAVIFGRCFFGGEKFC